LALDILRAIYSKCTTEKKGKLGHRDILDKGFRPPEELPNQTKKSLLLYILGYIVENKSLGRLKSE
jgi:hypothetical protein